METKKYMIYLEEYRARNKETGVVSKVFTGRDKGRRVREESLIDEKEKENDEIEIVIPDNIYSINPSFFEELLINVVTKLGKERFLEKFKFKSLGEYNVDKPLTEAIDRILRRYSALD